MEQTQTTQPTFPLISARTLALALAALLLGLGLVAWRGWQGRAPGEGSAEARFARDMAAHHEQAIEMALLIGDRTDDPALRTFALDIVLTQQGQLGQMQGWLAAWGLPYGSEEPVMGGHAEAMGMAAQADVNALRSLPLAEAEARFLQLMYRHHEGALLMVDEELPHLRRPEARRLAEAIRDGQRSELDFMTDLLAARGATPPEPLAPMEHEH